MFVVEHWTAEAISQQEDAEDPDGAREVARSFFVEDLALALSHMDEDAQRRREIRQAHKESLERVATAQPGEWVNYDCDDLYLIRIVER